jgi:nicotinamide-nucleotide amidase
MDTEIILIGNEFIGGMINPDLKFLINDLLLKLGIDFMTFVKEDEWFIEEAISKAIDRSGIIFIIGNLEVAGRAIAKVSQQRLVIREDILKNIREYFERKGIEMPKDYENRALVPQNATLMQNPVGIDFGFVVKYRAKHVIFLPKRGEGFELLIKEHLNPFLESEDIERERFEVSVLKNFGISRFYIRERLKGIEGGDIKVVNIFPENRIYIKVKNGNLSEVENRIMDILGDYIFGKNDETLEGNVGKLLKERGKKLSISESCTGGFTTHLLTNIPGSSEYLLGSVVTYSNLSKEDILKVPSEMIEKEGAVSSKVAIEMAKGVKNLYRSDIGVGITGIAGPGGGTPEKPVGTVFISIIGDDKEDVKGFRFKGNREEIKLLASYMSIELTRRHIIGIYS